MNQKEILTMGLISTFVFAATFAVIPAEAENSLEISDDDSVAQENAVKADQEADNDVVISGIGNTGSTSASQGIAVSQGNANEDNDVQTGVATQADTGDIALPLP